VESRKLYIPEGNQETFPFGGKIHVRAYEASGSLPRVKGAVCSNSALLDLVLGIHCFLGRKISLSPQYLLLR